MRFFKRVFKLSIALLVAVLLINVVIVLKTKSRIYTTANEIPEAYTAIVLGAYVSKSGYLSGILQDRVETAIELYKQKKVKRFLLSGDHGRTDYDEVNSMRNYLLKKGIKTEDIFLT